MKLNWILVSLFGAFAIGACSAGSAGSVDGADEGNTDDSGESSDELRRRKRDAGAKDGSTSVDAGAPKDARASDAKVAPPGPTPSDDPFEPGSCLGAPLTSAKTLSRFAPYTDEIAVGHYEIKTRSRACNGGTCTPWSLHTFSNEKGRYLFVRAIDATGPVVKVRIYEEKDIGGCHTSVDSTPLGAVVESGYRTAYFNCTSGSHDPRTCYGYCLTSSRSWIAKGTVTDTCMRLVATEISEPNAFGDTYEQQYVVFGTPDATTP